MRDILLDGGATIWRLRCREANEGEIPDSEFTAHLRTRAAELWRNIESEAPAQEREHRTVTCEQIRAIHPHRLRRYVRTLEQRLSARRAPTIVLRLTRPQVEVNPLAEFVGNDEAAMRDPPRANQMALDAMEAINDGGESFLRVHWVAVPKALRARRVNRRHSW